jgi:type VI secretion system VgrG family protein
MALDQTIDLTFTVDGGPEDQFRVFHFRGEEGISQLYRFDIDVVAREPDIDLADLIHRRATLTIADRAATRHVPGMVQDVTQRGETHSHQVLYRFTLVPRAAKLALSRQNQIYGTLEDVSALDVARAELTGEGVRGPGVEAASYLAAHDVDISRVWDADAYPKRDYIVQYDESDWAFISRLLEHWGIFYYFAHTPDGEQLVLGNGNHAFASVAEGDRGDAATGDGGGEPPAIPYRPTSGLGAAAEHAIHRVSARTKGLPKKLILKDYNWRNPSIPLQAETEVDPDGHGVVSLYGEHFRTPTEGQMLAQIRAEELRADKRALNGASDCLTLIPGHLFRLADHFRSDTNGTYVVVSVRHEGRQPLGDVVLDGDTTGPDYTNTFLAYPDDVPYRPPRRTPKPKVAGLFTAHVDAAGPGTRAEIDGDGCYKVRVPFDLAGSPHGKASRYVRRSQPYGGRIDQDGGGEPVSGFHFPLLKGTEVICACVNGDPDRPVIMGAMPNRLGPSVVESGSQTRNRIKTASGIVMQFEDSTP